MKRAASTVATASAAKKIKVEGEEAASVTSKAGVVHKSRVKVLRQNTPTEHGPVAYWMQRDLRLKDNWAFLQAQQISHETKRPLIVLYNRPHPDTLPSYVNTWRRASFELKGLRSLESELRDFGVPLLFFKGKAREQVAPFLVEKSITHVVCDYNPLREYIGERNAVIEELNTRAHACSVTLVDAHNIVPIWTASDKQEWMARTIRPRITNKLNEFLVEFPLPVKQDRSEIANYPFITQQLDKGVQWDGIIAEVEKEVDTKVGELADFEPGPKAGLKALDNFESRLGKYANLRNDPAANMTSHLSPYFNFGYLAPQRRPQILQIPLP